MGGGENHRPFYGQFLGAPSARRFVSTRARNIPRRGARAEFEAALELAVGDFLCEDFARAKAGFAADFLGSAYIRRAQRALDAAMHMNGFSGPVASKRVAVVLAAGLFES